MDKWKHHQNPVGACCHARQFAEYLGGYESTKTNNSSDFNHRTNNRINSNNRNNYIRC